MKTIYTIFKWKKKHVLDKIPAEQCSKPWIVVY